MANAYFPNVGHFYSSRSMPVKLDCSFTVAEGNGLGITGLSGPKIANIFLHTSTTPAVGNFSQTNPNPATGYMVVQLMNNYNSIYGWSASVASPNSGSDVKIDNSALTAGAVYVITTLGNATAAKWVAIGVPKGVTAAVGVSFVAASDGGAGNTLTSRVQVPATAGAAFDHIECVGLPSTMLQPVGLSVSPHIGAQLIFRFMKASGSAAAPTFTGSALGTHNHDLKIIGGQAAASTDAVSAKTLTLGKEAATDITIAGANSATLGGVVGASAGTPAGTISAPAFTTTSVIATPADGSLISLQLYLGNSSV